MLPRSRVCCAWVAAAIVALLTTTAAGRDRGIQKSAAQTQRSQDRQKPRIDRESIGLFEAVAQGKLQARLIPRSAKRCRVFLTNKTDQPLSVQLPEAFAGVPLLAQFAPEGVAQPGGQDRPQPQRVGGPFPNPPGNQRPPGGGPFPPGGNRPWLNVPPGHGPLLNIAPERTIEMKLTTVCLDLGKPNPRSTIPYEIRPIEEAVQEPALRELCRLMGRAAVPLEAAQAAAWHLGSGQTWEELRQKKTSRLVPVTPVFSAEDLDAARSLSAEATRLAKPRS